MRAFKLKSMSAATFNFDDSVAGLFNKFHTVMYFLSVEKCLFHTIIYRKGNSQRRLVGTTCVVESYCIALLPIVVQNVTARSWIARANFSFLCAGGQPSWRYPRRTKASPCIFDAGKSL